MMLMHAKARRPVAVHLCLWPYAVSMVVYIQNTVPVLNSLAAGNTIPKWSQRSHLGLNLGPSPNYTWNVNLVLNLNTGLVSPKFHCRYNDFFVTTRHSERDIMTSSNWKQLAGLAKYDGTPTLRDRLSSANQNVIPVGTNLPDGTNESIEFSQDIPPNDDISMSGDLIAPYRFLREIWPYLFRRCHLLHLLTSAIEATSER
ncbi:hypothetical protein ACHAW6_003364 [Cyclotella cf. meneghiniana]